MTHELRLYLILDKQNFNILISKYYVYLYSLLVNLLANTHHSTRNVTTYNNSCLTKSPIFCFSELCGHYLKTSTDNLNNLYKRI